MSVPEREVQSPHGGHGGEAGQTLSAARTLAPGRWALAVLRPTPEMGSLLGHVTAERSLHAPTSPRWKRDRGTDPVRQSGVSLMLSHLSVPAAKPTCSPQWSVHRLSRVFFSLAVFKLVSWALS